MLLLLASLTGAARAQSEQFRMGEERTWSQVAPGEGDASESTIARARKHLAEDNPAAARDLLDPWIEANRRPGHPSMPEALLVRGDALLALDREFTALYDYEEICKKHATSEAFPIAVERELDIAIRYANGLRIRILGLRWGDPEDVLVELLLRVNERLPGSQAAERATIELADYYYRYRELVQAKEVYDAYIESFPNGPNAIKARQRRIQCEVGRFKGPRYNAAPLIDAKVQVEQFERRYPAEAGATGLNAALAGRLDESMAAQLLDTAQWQLRVRDEPSARLTLRRLVRDHPLTISAEKAQRMMQERGWMSVPPPPQTEEPAADAISTDDPSVQPAPAEAPPPDAPPGGSR